jgi:hypothetical protein
MEEIEFVLMYYMDGSDTKYLYSKEVFSLLVNENSCFEPYSLDKLIEMWKEKNKGKEHLIHKMIGTPWKK